MNRFFNEIIAGLDDDIVRDLAWTIFSPELLNTPMTSFTAELTEERIQWLYELDDKPKSLHQQVHMKNRLGQYYENLWTYFFNHDRQYRLISKNLQLVVEGRTLGEFDFIIQDSDNNQTIHLEVAVKFYLHFAMKNNNDATDWQAWLGPNARDSLYKKGKHLLDTQSQLSQQPAARDLLSKTFDIDSITPNISVKGYLFDQHNLQPEGFAEGNNIHSWYTIDSLKDELSVDETLGFIAKHRWLNQTHQKHNIEIMHIENALELVKQRKTALMFCTFEDGEESDTHIHEVQRFFVVPDDWPSCYIK